MSVARADFRRAAAAMPTRWADDGLPKSSRRQATMASTTDAATRVVAALSR